jgi:hypothetical protein
VRNFVTALPKDEDRAGVVARTAGQALSGLVPHR